MPKFDRVSLLAHRIRDTRTPVPSIEEAEIEACVLVDIDESQGDVKLGQQARKAYAEADFFVDLSRGWKDEKPREDDSTHWVSQLDRIVKMIFGAPFLTPTRDERGMKVASVAQLQSAELGRQVGAAITTHEGELLAVGTNEVPKSGGGAYWTDDAHDQREFLRGDAADPARTYPREISDGIYRELVRKLEMGVEELGLELSAEQLERLVAPDEFQRIVSTTRLSDLIEFNRAVHAEMDAITTAARLGISIKDATIYTTTFPCHECTRHIIAAGIRRLVFIHPYPKSLAKELHDDALAVDHTVTDSVADAPVEFESFIGVAPRSYDLVFEYPRSDRRDKGLNGPTARDYEVWPRAILDMLRPIPHVESPSFDYPDREDTSLLSWSVIRDSLEGLED